MSCVTFWLSIFCSISDCIQSRPSFFSNGITTADLHTSGKVPSDKDTLIKCVNRGKIYSKCSFSRRVGSGSREQLVVSDADTSLWICSSESGEKHCSCEPSLCVAYGEAQMDQWLCILLRSYRQIMPSDYMFTCKQ